MTDEIKQIKTQISFSDRLIAAYIKLYDILIKRVEFSMEVEKTPTQVDLGWLKKLDENIITARLAVEAIQVEKAIMFEKSKHADWTRRLHNWEKEIEAESQECNENFDRIVLLARENRKYERVKKAVEVLDATMPYKSQSDKNIAYRSLRDELQNAKVNINPKMTRV